MPKLEVLLATMNQEDMSKYYDMNIQTDIVIANQAEDNYYMENNINGNKVKMITTNDKGVGKNRNLAMLYSSKEILLCADDDMRYVDNYEKGIIDAFEQLEDADVIIFSCNITKNGAVIRECKNQIKRVNIFNSMKYGACVIAFRRESITKNNIFFNQLFGGGCLYGAGEDSLFLKDCFNNRLKVYTHSFNIGNCSKDKSSWFTGYNDKYLYDKGAWIQCAFPNMKYIIALYFTYKFKKLCNKNYLEIFKLIKSGMSGYKNMKSFN